ncbi:hypothetical protein GCM10022255_094340 [Dactylosporangium darangshiense]|uniref:Uncharacterized protein n=1 Tax=Dactylosporangium darangshiense TaxID=579108 RepID=A0ABP8DQK1_9ACTN
MAEPDARASRRRPARRRRAFGHSGSERIILSSGRSRAGSTSVAAETVGHVPRPHRVRHLFAALNGIVDRANVA